MRVLYVCNDHAYFEAHRRPLANAAAAIGAKVTLATGHVLPSAQVDSRTASDGVPSSSPSIISLDVERHRFDLKRDIRLAFDIRAAAKASRADVVHLLTLKPIVFGALGLLFTVGPTRIIATFPGLGRVFDRSDRTLLARLRRLLVLVGLRIGLAPARAHAIFETPDDRRLLTGLGVIPDDRTSHISGAGVDPDLFAPAPLPDGPFRLLYAGRILRAKGVAVLAETVAWLHARNCPVEILIAGDTTEADPDALSKAELDALRNARGVTCLGMVPANKMPALLATVHAVILPTRYQEGIPRILIEAAAIGRPAIVSDNPGCAAIIADGVNGLILPEITAAAVGAAVQAIASDHSRLASLSEGALNRFQSGGFAMAEINLATLKLYGVEG
ncbi:MAG: glycosyltransferase [Hyphomicrobiales bacterium]|nr:glycosyltransferase [Hyphomicrobiales bacterium]